MSNYIILYFAAPKVIGDSARKHLRNQQKAEKIVNFLSYFMKLFPC